LSDRRPAQLSGGQKQRAALARILLTDPRMLLLDEPSRGLDARLRQSFWELLQSLRTRLNVPIVLVSHDIEEALELADFIIALDAGKLLQVGERDQFLRAPATLEVAHLLGMYNIAPVKILALDPSSNLSRLSILNQEIEGPYFPAHLIGDRGFLCIRRSEMQVAPRRESTKNQLTLRIESKHPSISGIRLTLEGGFSLMLSEADNTAYAVEDQITVSVPTAAMAFTGK
jgi:molybdate transport system ATP-binding protein